MDGWEVSFFGWYKAKTPVQKKLNWSGLRHIFTERWPEYESKNHLPAWSPTIYKNGTNRGAENVVAITCLVLDFDDGTPYTDAMEVFYEWPFFIHTSWSHTPEHNKWRIVLPLEAPVPARHWKACFDSAVELWEKRKPNGSGSPDRQCSDLPRIYFLPGKHQNGKPGIGYEHNDPDCGTHCLMLDAKAKPKPKPKRPVSRSVVGTSEEQIRHETHKRLKKDPELRARVADFLGGNLIESKGVVRAIVCPQCSDTSVWYWVDPSQKSVAVCNHKKSCGWWGHLHEIKPIPT